MKWSEKISLALYSLLAWMVQPLLRIKLKLRSRKEPEYGENIAARFGIYTVKPSAGWFWIHAVSLGETRAAGILIAQLRVRQPGLRLLLTHGTASGWIAGRALLSPGDHQEWFPWDTKGATERFLQHFRPSVGVMLETEVWPNLVQSCSRRCIPLFLVNARKCERSFGVAYRRRLLAMPAYRALTGVLAQGSSDAARFTALGARVISVTGNIKFDAKPAPEQLLQGKAWRRMSSRPVLMLASSREGEELAFVNDLVSRRASTTRPPAFGAGCQILIVPRHTQRTADLVSTFESRGLTVSCRSSWDDGPEPADIWLGDSMGELNLYYGMGDVALLGGSFEPFGGQNLIEATACGCPIILGPHTFNFEDAARWALSAGAALSAKDMHGAVDQALRLIQRPEELTFARQHCLEFAGTHHGAADATAKVILDYVDPTSVASTRGLPSTSRLMDLDLNLDHGPSRREVHQLGAS
jgi:3-deoxy-D-manno-octulosonic-acid transferase